MRVNVDSKALIDARFARLGARVTPKINRHEALGRCIPVWSLCYENRSPLLSAEDVDAVADLPGFAAAMVGAALADLADGALRLRGVEERIEFLIVQDAKRGKALEARRASAGLPPALPRDRPVDLPRGNPPARPVARPPDLPYSLDLDLAPDQAPTLAPDLDHDLSRSGERSDRPDQSDDMTGPEPEWWGNPKRKPPTKPPQAQGATKAARRRRMPEDWQPRQQERAQALQLGLDPDREAEEFRSYWIGDGRPKADWNATFRNRLIQQSKRHPSRSAPSNPFVALAQRDEELPV